jgi:ferredoxin
MANKQGIPNRYSENAPGKYYVVDTCNGCGLCLSLAIRNFAYSDDASYYYIYQQPQTLEEERQCREAMDLCPMHCVRDDGGSYQSFDDELYY